MLGIERKVYRSIVFIDFERNNAEAIIAEAMEVELVLAETGEVIAGKVQKIASKALLIKVAEEVGYREYEFIEIESIKDVNEEAGEDVE